MWFFQSCFVLKICLLLLMQATELLSQLTLVVSESAHSENRYWYTGYWVPLIMIVKRYHLQAQYAQKTWKQSKYQIEKVRPISCDRQKFSQPTDRWNWDLFGFWYSLAFGFWGVDSIIFIHIVDYSISNCSFSFKTPEGWNS